MSFFWGLSGSLIIVIFDLGRRYDTTGYVPRNLLTWTYCAIVLARAVGAGLVAVAFEPETVLHAICLGMSCEKIVDSLRQRDAGMRKSPPLDTAYHGGN